METKEKKIMKHVFWMLVLATIFFAGWAARGNGSFQRGFEIGYEAASNHISTRIRTGMIELQPFYVADIGFRFAPRGVTITNIKFIGDKMVYSAKAEAKE